MLVRLIYASLAPAPRATDLADILRTSRTKNSKIAITGALCYLDGAYMQYLEGEEHAVRDLYAAIEVDRRHVAPRVLERCAIAAQFFPAWSMSLLTWDDRIKTIFEGFGLKQPLNLYNTPGENAAAIFRALARTPNWSPA